ncbi:hypothetical protein [Thermus sp.]|uniref:hypothetical protein n=1 Tax=Thermus sp. TaxID=275 RepID=UPI003D0E214A
MEGLFPVGPKALRVRFLGEEPFSLEALEGADRILALTYSASEGLIRELAPKVGEMEVVFGHPTPVGKLDQLLALQALVLEEIQGEVKGSEAVLEALRSGRLRLLLSRRASHAKLYLVEKGGRRFALAGSANLSRRALEGGQAEVLFLVEDEEGVERLLALYREVRGEADPVRPEVLLRQAAPEDLPLLQAAEKRPVVVQVPKEVPVVYRAEVVLRRAKVYEPVAKEAKPRPGGVEIPPKAVKALKLGRARSEEEEGPPFLEVREEEGGVFALGELRPFLSLEDPEVREEAFAMARFLNRYLSGHFLHEEEAREQAEAYFRLWAWYWTAPLMSRLLRRAHLEGLSPHHYPLYALVFGKSGAGKTTFLRLLSRSLVGVPVDPIPGTELGKRALLALHESGSEFPVVFDDVAPRDFSEKVEPVVKSLYETPRGTLTPVAFSFNASQAYAPPEEVRRRAFLVHAQAVLDETRPEVAGRVRAEAERDLLLVRGAFFRAFLPGLLEALREEEDWLLASTRVLAALLGEVLGAPPPWARPQSLADLSQSRLAEVKEKMRALLKVHRLEWKAGKPHLRLGPDARRIGRELPGWLVEEVQGEVLILKEKGLEKLGLRKRAPWWPFRG